MKPIAVVTTVDSRAEAQAMARAMVERRLAACAQITAIDSYYEWEGAVREHAEYRVTFKTVAERYAGLEEAIRAMHSYELPAIHAVALERCYAPYAAWLEDNARG
jgi:periplasmic divalent cation tolerance protein